MRVSQYEPMNELIKDYGPDLQGVPQNKHGGRKTLNARHYTGEFGPASEGRSLSGEEFEIAKKKYENR